MSRRNTHTTEQEIKALRKCADLYEQAIVEVLALSQEEYETDSDVEGGDLVGDFGDLRERIIERLRAAGCLPKAYKPLNKTAPPATTRGTHTEVVVGLSGGVMTTVLYLRTAHDNPNDTVECLLVDYDAWGARDGDKADQTEEEFERERLNGRTWDDIVATHTAIW